MGFTTGSLVNLMQSRSAAAHPVAPEVGMGATELCWTDRHAYTVVAVSPSGKTITLQADTATRVDNNGMSECQNYEFSRDPNGQLVTARLTKKGWACKGRRFSLDSRSEYHDFSF